MKALLTLNRDGNSWPVWINHADSRADEGWSPLFLWGPRVDWEPYDDLWTALAVLYRCQEDV